MAHRVYLVALVCSSLLLVSAAVWLSIGMFELMGKVYLTDPPIEEKTALIDKVIEKSRSDGVSESYISILSASKEAEEARHEMYNSFTDLKKISIEVLLLFALLHLIFLFQFIRRTRNA